MSALKKREWLTFVVHESLLTLSRVFLSAFLSFSSLTTCFSASFFSVSSMATARCSPRRRSSMAARSIWADWALRWASARLVERWRRTWHSENKKIAPRGPTRETVYMTMSCTWTLSTEFSFEKQVGNFFIWVKIQNLNWYTNYFLFSWSKSGAWNLKAILKNTIKITRKLK